MADFRYDPTIYQTLLSPHLGLNDAMGDNGGGEFAQMPRYSSLNGGGGGLIRILDERLNRNTPGNGDSNPGYSPTDLLLVGLRQGIITPEQVAPYLLDKSGAEGVQADPEAINTLAALLESGDFSREAQMSGLTEADIERQMAGDLARYGITDPSQIGVYTNEYGDTFYYNKETGNQIPSYFGSDMSGENGRRFRIRNGPDGQVVLQAEQKTSSDWEAVRDIATLVAAMGGAYYAGGQLAAGQAAQSGAAFNASIGPTTGEAFGGTGAGLAGGETTLGSGTFGLESLGSGALNISEGAAAAGGFTPSTIGGPLDLGTAINGTGTAGLGLTQVTNAMPNITPDGQPAPSAPTPNAPNPTQGSTPNVPPGTGNGGGIGNGDILGLLASLYGANNTGWIDDLRDIAGQTLERADPFGPQRPFYQDRLRETYENPQAVYDRDYTALDNVFFNELRAQDAARGRSTDSYKRGVEREAKFQDWMLDNRTQLGGFAGANIDPSNAAGNYLGAMTNLGMLERNQQMAPWQAVGNFLGGRDGLSLNDIGDAAGTVYDWGSRLYDFFGG